MTSGPSPLYSVHLSTAKSWRGGENQLFLLAHGLVARGQRVLVVAPRGAPLLERCAAANVPNLGLRLSGEVDPFATLKLISLLRRERPQILHLHDGHAVLHGQLAGRALPRRVCRVIAHRRTVFPLKGRWKYSGRIDRVIAISHAVRDELRKAGISDEKTRVVYSGVDFPEIPSNARAEWRSKLSIGDGELLAVHAAALSKEKRQLDLIASVCAANETLKKLGRSRVHLALAGSGSEDETLRAEVARRSASDVVHFTGFLKDVAELLAAGDVAVYASEAEGLCTALVQAQGAGLPAIVTRAGGMPEVVEDGTTGIVVPVGDTAAFADGLVKLAGEPGLREKFGRAGAERAKKMFSAEAMIEGVLGVYKEP
ncbi:MAG TPA: glycosyltransferase family 4 protein [Planctomycetota bacterium]|nr:glycosyltransferase family 4 protein [Planctomycetota bacterium]